MMLRTRNDLEGGQGGLPHREQFINKAKREMYYAFRLVPGAFSTKLLNPSTALGYRLGVVYKHEYGRKQTTRRSLPTYAAYKLGQL
jgi:hypothetical protein